MDVYNFNSSAYLSSRCTQEDPRMPLVLPMIGTKKDVLDLGCLDGTLGELFVKQGNRVKGIDASKEAIQKARDRGVDARLGNLDEPFPFADASFDVVFAGEIIEHVFEVDQFVEEAFRVLRPGGFFIVTTPNLAAFGRRLLLLLNRNPHIEISFKAPDAAGHIRYFIASTLKQFLTSKGFVIQRHASDIVNFNSTGSIASKWLAQCFPALGKTLIMQAMKPF
jgi:2-polyprenyl-3-methyl-5-hydroxy-6-metoxy-1,4-benzoquinol methylase